MHTLHVFTDEAFHVSTYASERLARAAFWRSVDDTNVRVAVLYVAGVYDNSYTRAC